MLLKYVKKDSNLNPYPGTIQIPGNLYTRSNPMKSPAEKSKTSNRQKAKKRSTAEKTTPNGRSSKKRKIDIRSINFDSEEEEEQQDDILDLGLSPIPQSRSPHEDYNKQTDDTGAVTETPSSSQSSGKSFGEETKKMTTTKTKTTPVRRS